MRNNYNKYHKEMSNLPLPYFVMAFLDFFTNFETCRGTPFMTKSRGMLTREHHKNNISGNHNEIVLQAPHTIAAFHDSCGLTHTTDEAKGNFPNIHVVSL